MNLPKLLFISIAFPPKSDPECIQTGRFYNALIGLHKYNIQVLTSSSPTLFMNDDDSLKQYLTPNDNIIKIKINEWKVINWLLRKLLPNGIDWPDSKFMFHIKWKQASRKVAPPDIIYSRAFPLSSTIMAYKLADYFKVPWVLHLSDPWSISPVHSRSQKNQLYQEKWEEKCFNKAKFICFTTNTTINLYKKKYPHLKHKFKRISNVPHEHMHPITLNWKHKLKITHTGGLAGQRSPIHIIKALENLVSINPEIENTIEVIFAGNIDRGVAAIFESTNLKCINYIGNISLDQSIDLQKKSHILLSIDNPITKGEQAMFIPSKLYDYINSNRRVLAITTKNSSTDLFLNDFISNILTFDNTLNLQPILENYIKKFKEKDETYFQQKNLLPSELGITHNTQKLIGLLNKCGAQ